MIAYLPFKRIAASFSTSMRRNFFLASYSSSQRTQMPVRSLMLTSPSLAPHSPQRRSVQLKQMPVTALMLTTAVERPHSVHLSGSDGFDGVNGCGIREFPL